MPSCLDWRQLEISLPPPLSLTLLVPLLVLMLLLLLPRGRSGGLFPVAASADGGHGNSDLTRLALAAGRTLPTLWQCSPPVASRFLSLIHI